MKEGPRNADWLFWAMATLAGAYSLGSIIYLGAFWHRFHNLPLSKNPSDWTDFAGMLGALIGTSLGFLSLVYVIRTVRLQQQQIDTQQKQHSEWLEREEKAHDPDTSGLVTPAKTIGLPRLEHGGLWLYAQFTSRSKWLFSAAPGQSNWEILPANNALGINVASWPMPDREGWFHCWLKYRRPHGTEAWVLIEYHPSRLDVTNRSEPPPHFVNAGAREVAAK